MPERGMEGVIRGGVPGGVSNAAKRKLAMSSTMIIHSLLVDSCELLYTF